MDVMSGNTTTRRNRTSAASRKAAQAEGNGNGNGNSTPDGTDEPIVTQGVQAEVQDTAQAEAEQVSLPDGTEDNGTEDSAGAPAETTEQDASQDDEPQGDVVEEITELLKPVGNDAPVTGETPDVPAAEEAAGPDEAPAESDSTPDETPDAPEGDKPAEDPEPQPELTDEQKAEAVAQVTKLEELLAAARAAAGVSEEQKPAPKAEPKEKALPKADACFVTKSRGSAGPADPTRGERIMVGAHKTQWDSNGKPRAFRVLEVPDGVKADSILPVGAIIHLRNRITGMDLGEYIRVDGTEAEGTQALWMLTTATPQHVTLPEPAKGEDGTSGTEKEDAKTEELVASE
jgi:hypothetical protein